MGIGAILGLALLGTQLFKSLFPGKSQQQGQQTQETTQTTTEMPRGYQSPFLGLADLYSLMGGAQRNAAYEGWGWPEGEGPKNPFGADFIQALMSVWPDVLNAYKQGSKPAGESAADRIAKRREEIRRTRAAGMAPAL